MKTKDLREARGTNPISPAGTHRVIYHRKNIDDYPDPNLPTREQEMQAQAAYGQKQDGKRLVKIRKILDNSKELQDQLVESLRLFERERIPLALLDQLKVDVLRKNQNKSVISIGEFDTVYDKIFGESAKTTSGLYQAIIVSISNDQMEALSTTKLIELVEMYYLFGSLRPI